MAALAALAGTVLAGLLEGPGSGSPPATLLLLARCALLFLALAWALAWSVLLGVPGAVVASLALWGGLAALGGRLGRLDLFAPPQSGGGQAQALALLVALALLALAWVQVGRHEGSLGR